jgi:hypothetical protein
MRRRRVTPAPVNCGEDAIAGLPERGSDDALPEPVLIVTGYPASSSLVSLQMDVLHSIPACTPHPCLSCGQRFRIAGTHPWTRGNGGRTEGTLRPLSPSRRPTKCLLPHWTSVLRQEYEPYEAYATGAEDWHNFRNERKGLRLFAKGAQTGPTDRVRTHKSSQSNQSWSRLRDGRHDTRAHAPRTLHDRRCTRTVPSTYYSLTPYHC